MKITRIEAEIVDVPATEPLAGVVGPMGRVRPTVILTLGTDEGVEGIGFTFLGAGLTRALHAAVEDLGALAIGEDPLRREHITAKIRAAAEGAGPAGVFTLAVAAIDIALWDIAGKVAGEPLWRLLGGSGRPVPTYASGAMMREFALDDCVAGARILVDRGFRAMKMQLALPGDGGVSAEIRRAEAIRDAVGPDVELMCDINRRWRVEEAIAIGRRLEHIGFAWLEDPSAPDDYAGLARIAEALATPVACGEYLWGVAPFREMAVRGSADVFMIDPFRAGGITGWLRVAALAAAFERPVVSHLAPEIQIHLIGAVPNGMNVEYMPWSVALFREVPVPVDGRLEMPTAPGLGLAFDRAAIARFRR